MKYLIVGTSSGLGRELAYTFAREKHKLVLVARDDRDLQAIKSDLNLKFGIEIKTISFDFSDIEEINKNILSDNEVLNNLNGVLFPIGFMFEKDNSQLDIVKINKMVFANFISINYLTSKFLEVFKDKEFSIVSFGSVSGLLGRNLNVNYAASKRALESFFESLAFEKKFEEINIQFYVLGYLDTNLAFGKNLLLPKGSTKKLAEIVFKNLNKKFKKRHFPFFWGILAIILKIIPFSIILLLKRFLNK